MNKKQALEICRAWEKAANLKRVNKLTPERARDIVTEGITNIFSATGETLPSSTVSAWANSWLAAKEPEIKASTHTRYSVTINRFLNGLGEKQDRDLLTIRPTDIQEFRDRQVRELSPASANLGVKTVRMMFGAALRQGLLTANPAVAVDIIKARGESRRRPFTHAELARLLTVADPEWKGLIMFGLYTGQRLGDLVRLTWRAINLETGELSLVTQKTGRRMNLPLRQSLIDYLGELPSTDNLDAPIFPKASAMAEKRVGTVSNQFHDLLVEAGLAQHRTHTATKGGRRGGRTVSELSFHSLRHNTATMLRATGTSDAVAKAILGHDTEAVARQYTHLGTSDLRNAINQIPDITQLGLPTFLFTR